MESITTDIVVIGAGPGGYAAAFYAADKGKRVILVEQDARLGGVCLNRGCIPSKALLHATALMREANASGDIRGITFGVPHVNLATLRAWKESVLERLGQGISGLSRQRGVAVWHGRAQFEDSTTLRVQTEEGLRQIRYQTAIVAVGSQPTLPEPFALGDPRIMTSTEALELDEIPPALLVVGGGYIGLELGTVYATLGSRVVLVEAMESILMGVDPDLARPVVRYVERAFAALHLGTTVAAIDARGTQLHVTVETHGERHDERYDRVLVCIGRVPNCEGLGLERTKVTRDAKGFIAVNERQQTADPSIYAIGDVVGGPLLAHKAAREARVAVEVIAGEASSRADVIIPAVVFTDPEIAWCGLTEAEARARGVPVEVAKFPWSASGKAVSLDRPDGLTKLIVDPETERILGVGIVGVNAGELIGEGVLAIELGATANEMAKTVHPHPTLSETLQEAAELFYGYATHAVARKRRDRAVGRRV